MRTVIKANVVCLSILLLITMMAVSAWPLELTKSFTDDPVHPGDTVTLEFTIQNTDAAEATDITFTDDLDAALSGLVATGLPMNDLCGAGSQLAGTSTLTLTGGTLGPTSSCTFSMTLQVPMGASPGTYSNTTGPLTGTVGVTQVTGNPASDGLTITVLKFSKSFDGSTVPGGTTTLSFTIENVSSTETVTNLSFTDDLAAVLSGLTAISLPADGFCGAGSSISGTSFLTMTGGTLPAGGSCTFSVTLQVPAGASPGSYPNTTSSLFLVGIPVTDPATASLNVEPPPAFYKVFAPNIIANGGTSTLTFTIDNTASSLAATALAFTDTLPAGVVVADPPNASTICTGGSLTATAGSSIITYSGGSVAAGASCTIQVDVTSNAVGIHQNITSDLTSSSGNSGHASADLTVELPPAYPVTYDANGADSGTAPANQTKIYNVALTLATNTDSLARIGYTFNGWNTATDGSGTHYDEGATYTENGPLTLYAEWTPVPYTVTYDSNGATGGTVPADGNTYHITDTVTVLGNTGTLMKTGYTFDGWNTAADGSGTDYSGGDTFAMGSSNVTLYAQWMAIDYTVTYDGNTNTGGSVPTDGNTYNITDTVTVLGNTGSLVKTGYSFTGWNTAANGSGTSYSGGDTFAMGSSNVTLYARWTEPPPIFSKNFSPETILSGGTSTLTFTIDNTASALAATGLAFTDNLPDGVVVATPPNASAACTGGSLTATDGSSTITYSGGSVPAGASCTIQVDVTSSTAGIQTNTTGDLTSSSGNSGPATASLTVGDEPATIPTLNEFGMLVLFLLTIAIGFVFIYRRHA
ncbi:MAG TPA: InlB B-repeat-containing protein [Desulfobacteraceae bacterium]|nr:InlB B-repeat-containing protein [Desulfobacteraceae bacterium]